MLKISDYSIDFLYLAGFGWHRARFIAPGAWISVAAAGMRACIASLLFQAHLELPPPARRGRQTSAPGQPKPRFELHLTIDDVLQSILITRGVDDSAVELLDDAKRMPNIG